MRYAFIIDNLKEGGWNISEFETLDSATNTFFNIRTLQISPVYRSVLVDRPAAEQWMYHNNTFYTYNSLDELLEKHMIDIL